MVQSRVRKKFEKFENNLIKGFSDLENNSTLQPKNWTEYLRKSTLFFIDFSTKSINSH